MEFNPPQNTPQPVDSNALKPQFLHTFENFIALFSRDFRLWFIALSSSWHWLLGACMLVSIITFLIVTFFVPDIYQARCGLFRAEPKDARLSGLPESYVPLQRSIVINMVLSRANINKTITDLNLNTDFDTLFKAFSIQFPERNSSYFHLCATSKSPEIAAQLANTQASNFLNDYKEQIANQIKKIQRTNLINQTDLKQQKKLLEDELDKLKQRYAFEDISIEIKSLLSKIEELERSLYMEKIAILSKENKINSLEESLLATPDSIIMYEEVVAQEQNELLSQELELARLEQRYTDRNPLVIKQREVVRRMRELSNNQKNSEAKKVVSGVNQVHISIQKELQSNKMELVSLKSGVMEQEKVKNTLSARYQELLQIEPRINILLGKINLQNTFISEINTSIGKLNMFLEQGYSDITIYESAFASKNRLPKRKALFSLAAFFATFILIGGGLAIKEVFNVKIRCGFSVSSLLGLNIIAAIPVLKDGKQNLFYIGVRETVQGFLKLKNYNDEEPTLLNFAASHKDIKNESFVEKETLDSARLQNVKILCVKCIEEVTDEKAPYLINDFVYGLSNKPLIDSDIYYFLLDDMINMIPVDILKLKKIKKYNPVNKTYVNYDFVFFRLFDFNVNPLLFTRFCSQSAGNIFLIEYNITTRFDIMNQLNYLRSNNITNTSALIYNVDPKFLYMVNS